MDKRFRLGVAAWVIVIASLFVLPQFENIQAQEPGSDGLKIVIVYLADQAQASLAPAVQAGYEAQQQRLTQEVGAAGGLLAAQAQRPVLATREEENEYVRQLAAGPPGGAAVQGAYGQALGDLENSITAMRQEILDSSAAGRQASQDTVAQVVSGLGGQVIYRYEVINALAVAIPPEAEAALAARPEVAAVFDNQLLEAQLDISARSIGADTWWAQGYTGGTWDVAIIDSGIHNDHAALSSHRFVERRCLQTADALHSGMPGWDPTAEDLSGHGTHIAGIVGSTNSFYRGVAFGLDLLINGKAAFFQPGMSKGQGLLYFADGMACADWALQNGADVLNFSFGTSAFNDDGGVERFWDAVISQLNVVVAMSAGNQGPLDFTVSSPGIAYNVISVANMNDGSTVSRGDDIISSNSSRGPSPAGRKKPDLAAPGTFITSTDNSSANGFFTLSGTSMAAPHVAGAATLIMSAGVTDPIAIKALLINTAKDLGTPGWDAAYGWGYIDLQNLRFHLFDYFTDSLAASPDYKFYAGPASAGDTASLVWHRRAAYSGPAIPSTVYTLTDLDLYLYNEASNVVLSNSTSRIDNVEQVKANAGYGSVVIKVDSFAVAIAGASAERYALATQENFTRRVGPALDVIPISVSGDIRGPAGTVITINARVQNKGDLRAHGTNLSISYSAGLVKNSGNDANSLGSLAAGGNSGTYSWQFTKLNDDTTQWIRLNVLSASYGETFTDAWLLGGHPVYLPLINRGS